MHDVCSWRADPTEKDIKIVKSCCKEVNMTGALKRSDWGDSSLFNVYYFVDLSTIFHFLFIYIFCVCNLGS